MIFRYAPAWKRLVSYGIDVILSYIFTLIIYLKIALPLPMWDWVIFGTFMTYNVLMDYKYQGTLGKRIMKLRVIQTNGENLKLSASLYRNFGKIISAIPLGWGFIRILTPNYSQTIHDELARCYVVESK